MIREFNGEYRFLSNFYPSEIVYGDLVFPTVEHAYQAYKSKSETDWRMVAALPTPTAAKRMGGKLPLRPDWDQVKIPAMYELLQKKFQIPHLNRLLLATGDQELIEGNYWGDTFWGICRGKGANNLGKLLMKIRQENRGN